MPSILSTLAHASVPFISTFVCVHVAAPASAVFGGTSLASQVMILGREYYKTPFGHTYLVVLPMAIHTISAVLKRILGERSSRPFRSAFVLTGYAMGIFFLPVHYLIHRVLPSNPAPPIFAVSPSELDYEYVKFGLQQWPLVNWPLYAGLLGCLAWHVSVGYPLVWNTWFAGTSGAWRVNTKRRVVGVLAAVLPVLAGVFKISSEPLMIFSTTAERYDAAFRQLFLFRV